MAKKSALPIAKLVGVKLIIQNIIHANDIFSQGRFGVFLEDKSLQLSLIEGLYLLEKDKIKVKDGTKNVKKTDLMKLGEKKESSFHVRYVVYKDMRNRGYIIKTALKFGAEFRVYDRGVKPGEDHAKWLLYPVDESDSITWYNFASKSRVAHSTRKRLLIAIVDEESDITYYEIKWTKP